MTQRSILLRLLYTVALYIGLTRLFSFAEPEPNVIRTTPLTFTVLPADVYTNRDATSVMKSVLIVIPYRDQEKNADRFLAHFVEYIRERRSRGFQEYHYHLVFAEQVDSDAFNRAKNFDFGYIDGLRLLQDSNPKALALGRSVQSHIGWFADDPAGVQRAKKSVICGIVNDVDLLPAVTVDYGDCRQPTRLVSEPDCARNDSRYSKPAGGVFAFTPAGWDLVNGMSLEYSGWSGEDDDLYWRLVNSGIHDPNKNIRTPPRGEGFFKCLTRKDDQAERTEDKAPESFDDEIPKLQLMKGGSDIWREDGLKSAEFVREYSKVVTLDVDALDGDALKQHGISWIDWRVSGGMSSSDIGLHGTGASWSGFNQSSLMNRKPTPYTTERGKLSVYWNGLVSPMDPVNPIEVRIEPGVCGNYGQERTLKLISDIPLTMKLFYESVGCHWRSESISIDSLLASKRYSNREDRMLESTLKQEANIYAVSLESGRAVSIKDWPSLIRWYRTRRGPGRQGAIVFTKAAIAGSAVDSMKSFIGIEIGKPVGLEPYVKKSSDTATWVPRLKSICAANCRVVMDKTLAPDRLYQGSSSCSSETSQQTASFSSIDGEDSDLLYKFLSANTRFPTWSSFLAGANLVRLCSAEAGTRPLVRIDKGADCGGVIELIYYTNMGSFWVSTDKKRIYGDNGKYLYEGQPSHEFCVGHHTELRSSRIMKQADCGTDGYKHILGFNQIVIPPRQLLAKLCDSGASNCQKGLIAVSGEFASLVPGAVEFCLESGKRKDCSLPHETKYGIVPATGSSPVFCVGDRTNHGPVCVSAGTCETSSCKNGKNYQSINLDDLPTDALEFGRT